MNALAVTLCLLAWQPDLVEELLKQPAPAADWREKLTELRARMLPSLRPGPSGEPADEAPLDSLLSFWAGLWFHVRGGCDLRADRVRQHGHVGR